MFKKLLAVCVLGLLSLGANAQNVNGNIQLIWTLPTTTTDGLPLTGTNALTELRIWLSTSPIAANTAAAPTITLAGGVTNTTYSMVVPNGSTVYARMKACNRPAAVTECSIMTGEVSKVIQAATTPNMPTGVSINLTITP